MIFPLFRKWGSPTIITLLSHKTSPATLISSLLSSKNWGMRAKVRSRNPQGNSVNFRYKLKTTKRLRADKIYKAKLAWSEVRVVARLINNNNRSKINNFSSRRRLINNNRNKMAMIIRTSCLKLIRGKSQREYPQLSRSKAIAKNFQERALPKFLRRTPMTISL